MSSYRPKRILVTYEFVSTEENIGNLWVRIDRREYPDWKRSAKNLKQNLEDIERNKPEAGATS